MNKQERLYKLKMKYFWQQKAVEVGIFLGVLIVGIFAPYWTGRLAEVLLVPLLGPIMLDGSKPSIFFLWFIGFFVIIAIVLSVMIIFLIGSCIVTVIMQWVQNNLEKAESRARQELK